jgi:purine-cytosine permease-like protein
MVESFRDLGPFGFFCSVIVALGLIASLIPPTYSLGIDFQTFGTYFLRALRVIWNAIGVIVTPSVL